MVLFMRRSYIEAHCSLRDAFTIAARWGGEASVSLLAPSTRSVEQSPWLERSGVPIGTVGNRHSRFAARPHGIVIAWCLRMDELLDLEGRHSLDGVALVHASAQHAPWITAHEAEHIGGNPVAAVGEASAAITATLEGLSVPAILNQGLVDSRERSAAVQALTYLRRHGHQIDPDQLATEALRQDWPRQSPLDLARIARDLNAGKTLRFQQRLNAAALARWADGDSSGS